MNQVYLSCLIRNVSRVCGRRFGFFFIIAFCCIDDLHAQYLDFGAWAGVSVKKELVDDLDLEVGAQLRLSENYTFLSSNFVDVDLGYKFNKWFSVAGSYRYAQKNDYRSSWETRHRWQLGFSVKKKMKPADFQFRTQYQIGFRNINEGWYNNESYWRNKLQVKIDVDKKFEPYLGTELFYKLNYNFGVDSYRIVAGLNWDLPKKMELKTGYLFQQEIRVSAPITEHIIQVGFSKKL